MNVKNLHQIIDRYEANFELINSSEHNEIFKWKTAKCFRDAWFSADKQTTPFSVMFAKARKEAAWILDNSRVSPTNGIVKMAEKHPEAVANLFFNVLLIDEGGDLSKRQEKMEAFLEGIESIRKIEFPKCWKYKQDRHTASCYLAFVKPDDNYIYRYSDAEAMAKNIEFGMDIGAGGYFSLPNYYSMCDQIVEALRQHKTLIKKHYELIESGPYYRDESLHILAFDLMYCARCYDFYSGIQHASKKDSLEAQTLKQIHEKTQRERAEKEAEIQKLLFRVDVYRDISLLGVEVFQNTYGKGTIIKHNMNQITVRFDSVEKTFVINRKFALRPTFEDDDEIVSAYTEYANILERINNLKDEICRL